MTGSDPATGRRQAGWWWPWFIVALLIATAAGQGIMYYEATHDPTFAIEPDYYSKAVAYDTAIVRARENVALGWRPVGVMTAASPSDAAVRVVLTDSLGLPVIGARVRGSAIHNLDGSHPVAVQFTDAGGGAYVATMAGARRGLWEFRLDAVRENSHFTPSLRVDYSP